MVSETKQISGSRLGQIDGSALAVAAVHLDLEIDFLTFAQRSHSRAFDSRDVNKNILLAAVRLDEAEALGGVEKLYSAEGHDNFPLDRQAEIRP